MDTNTALLLGLTLLIFAFSVLLLFAGGSGLLFLLFLLFLAIAKTFSIKEGKPAHGG